MELFSPENFPFPMHSIHIWKKGELLQESNYAPYKKGELHRMFSVTKSFTSLAIGALIAEGKLSLSDKICDRFPEYCPEEADPRLTSMCIKDMLTMRTCHRTTTYKLSADTHWVRSFFITAPDHEAGRIFKYDTSSAHTLAALVLKRSGKGVLDYLREVFLDRIGFSEDARILTDPFGCEIGGSGLICRPEDLLRTARFLLSLLNDSMKKDFPDVCGYADSLYDRAFFIRFSQYIKDAVSFHCPTLHEGKTLDEMQGYGYQFWRIRDGGVMMYGMGGQYVVIYPQAELIFVTTADTQSVQGGTQYILDEIRRIALSLAPELSVAPAGPDHSLSPVSIASDQATPINPSDVSLLYGDYELLTNPGGFQCLSLTPAELVLKEKCRSYVFPYKIRDLYPSLENVYGQKIYTAAYPQCDGSLYLRTQILDEYVGCIHFLLKGEKDQITVFLRKAEESLYPGFNGFLDGRRIHM
ncbi:MAG: serine hydrolase [Lachnospiraceae bacterium]|nr:serine hydrolase [Lachnospiraceae bacterium]